MLCLSGAKCSFISPFHQPETHFKIPFESLNTSWKVLCVNLLSSTDFIPFRNESESVTNLCSVFLISSSFAFLLKTHSPDTTIIAIVTGDIKRLYSMIDLGNISISIVCGCNLVDVIKLDSGLSICDFKKATCPKLSYRKIPCSN